MANPFTVNRTGQINQGGSATALFLKVFGGEVLHSFTNATVMMGLQMVRTITSGKSAQFPVTGTLTAARHTPGAEIVGTSANQNEKVINIDDLLVSSFFLASIDEAMSHFDVRGEYSRQAGITLALKYDALAIQCVLTAARSAATLTGGNGGSSLIDANYAAVSTNLKAGLLAAAQKLDEKNIPSEDRHVLLKPAQYYLLLNDGVTSSITNRDIGGVGNIANASLPQYAGLTFHKTNQIPSTNYTTQTGENNTDYVGNFTTTVAPIFHRSCIGTVKLMDVAVESDYLLQNQGWLTVAKIACGIGVLRPESAVELKTA
jgi:hypothetical protein